MCLFFIHPFNRIQKHLKHMIKWSITRFISPLNLHRVLWLVLQPVSPLPSHTCTYKTLLIVFFYRIYAVLFLCYPKLNHSSVLRVKPRIFQLFQQPERQPPWVLYISSMENLENIYFKIIELFLNIFGQTWSHDPVQKPNYSTFNFCLAHGFRPVLFQSLFTLQHNSLSVWYRCHHVDSWDHCKQASQSSQSLSDLIFFFTKKPLYKPLCIERTGFKSTRFPHTFVSWQTCALMVPSKLNNSQLRMSD